MLGPRQSLTLLTIILLLFSVGGLAQDVDQEGDKSKIKQLTPTIHGSTGLFNVYLAETLRQGEFSVGFHTSKFHREPGDIDFHLFPVSFTIGLHDRIELFGSYEVHRRVNMDQIMVNKIVGNGPVVPARVLGGQVAFYNDAPFMDVGFGDGAGDLWTGIKFNLASENRGAPASFALQPIARFHLTDNREHLVRGLTAGATDWGFDAILSKNLGGGATFGLNAGLLFAQDRLNVDRQHRFRYGIGVDAPLGTPAAHFIAELVGSLFLEDNETSQFANPVSPADIYAGLRFFPARWIAIGGAYNFNLRTIDSGEFGGIDETDRHGFFAQVVLQRKINRPPTIECEPASTTVTEGDQVTITAHVSDPDDDVLSITWRASGGAQITQQGENTAVLNTTGLSPGTYTVTAEVSDGENTAVCSTDVVVEKRMLPPTIECEPQVVNVTEGESVTLRAQASDPNNDPLTYAWQVNGESVPNDQPTFEFGTAGRDPGTYTVRVTVTDVDGMTASCEFTVNVEQRPNRPPTVDLSLSDDDVSAGEQITATADASDPDGDPLTYSWTVDGQSRPETGSQITIDTAGMTGGEHSVTVTVNDGRGGTASDTATFTVTEAAVVIQVDNRIDNIAKAQLDEIAVRMQQDSRLRAIMTGHTDDRGTEEANQRVGMRRAELARDYLVQQHNIDANRIETRSAGESEPIASNETAEGRRQNRRVEVQLVLP
ncbi:MAG: PKD domain-containing protein [Acidobacteriota bacterium]